MPDSFPVIRGPFVGLYRWYGEEGPEWVAVVDPDAKPHDERHDGAVYYEFFKSLSSACVGVLNGLEILNQRQVDEVAQALPAIVEEEKRLLEKERELKELEERARLLRAQLNERREAGTSEPPQGWGLEA